MEYTVRGVLLAYVDESYTKTHYWIVALLCPEGMAIPLTKLLDDVVDRAAASYPGVSTTAELHGHALFHGRDDWRSVAALARARIGIYNDAFDAIASTDVRVIIRGVDIARLKVRYAYPDHPHSVVLAHLLERIDETAEEQNELALVIADEVDQADEHRRNLWRFQRFSTTGYRSRQLERIVDTMHFAPSRASRLVQAADLIAYLHQRIESGVEKDERAIRANEALRKRIADRIVHRHCWRP